MAKDSKGQTSIYKYYKLENNKAEKIKRECPTMWKRNFYGRS